MFLYMNLTTSLPESRGERHFLSKGTLCSKVRDPTMTFQLIVEIIEKKDRK